MSLGEVGKMLEEPKWLPNKWIDHLGAFAGGVPVDVVQGDSIFSIVALPREKAKENCSYICLRLRSGLSREEVGAALRGEHVPDRVAKTRIKQIGFVEYN